MPIPSAQPANGSVPTVTDGAVPPARPATRMTAGGVEVGETVGVEEEFLVVDRETGELVPRGTELIAEVQDLGEHVSAELNRCQVEVDTPVCRDLESLRREVVSKRDRLRSAGDELGLGPAAVATHPFSGWRDQAVDTDDERYEVMEDRFRLLAREHVICGCHVHVGISDPDDRVAVLAAAGVWLPTLLAMSTNSPYWQGEDTGYASYRTVIWSRWPTSGMPPSISSPEELQSIIDDLVAIGAIEDETHLYWWVRPSLRHPTVEFRVCDTFLFVDDVVAVTGLIRALCWTALNAPETLPTAPRRQVLRAAVWHAARYGMRRDLMDPGAMAKRPAGDVARSLVDLARPGLEHFGDDAVVPDLVDQLIARGTGASLQRLTRAEETSGAPVIDMVLERMHT